MSKEEILTYLAEMEDEDKLYVAVKLNSLIRIQEEDIKYQEMNNKYLGTMKKLAGENFLASQKRPDVQARIVLAICLMEDGKTLVSAARMLGVDHSTVSHYKNVWRNATKYPKVYADMLTLYNKYRNAL